MECNYPLPYAGEQIGRIHAKKAVTPRRCHWLYIYHLLMIALKGKGSVTRAARRLLGLKYHESLNYRRQHRNKSIHLRETLQSYVSAVSCVTSSFVPQRAVCVSTTRTQLLSEVRRKCAG